MKRRSRSRLEKYVYSSNGKSREDVSSRASVSSSSRSNTSMSSVAGTTGSSVASLSVSLDGTIMPYDGVDDASSDWSSWHFSKNAQRNMCAKLEMGNELTVYDRMSWKSDGLEYLRTVTKPPEMIQPDPPLPIWEKIPIESKIPLLDAPPGTISYSRGHMCEKLARGTKNSCLNPDSYDYSENDPLDLTYNALHDPNLKFFLKRPKMIKHLVRQGLISPTGKVLCSLQEFNKYREYLRHLHRPQLKNTMDLMHKNRTDIHVLKKNVETGGTEAAKIAWEKKLKETREKARAAQEIREARLQEIVRVREDREERFQLEIQHKKRQRSLLQAERNHIKDAILRSQFLSKNNQRLNLVAALQRKEIALTSRGFNCRASNEFKNRQKAVAWYDKWNNYERRHYKKSAMVQDFRAEMQERAIDRQDQVLKNRAAFFKNNSAIVLKRKAFVEKRLAKLASKYIELWRAKVKDRNNIVKRSLKIESTWDLHDDFRSTMFQIREKSEILAKSLMSLVEPDLNNNRADVEESHEQPICQAEAVCTSTSANAPAKSDSPNLQSNEPEKLPVSKKRNMARQAAAAGTLTLLTEIVQELELKSVEMNVHVVAHAILRDIAGSALKRCSKVCTSEGKQTSESIQNECSKQFGDKESNSELKTIFQRESPIVEEIPNSAAGDCGPRPQPSHQRAAQSEESMSITPLLLGSNKQSEAIQSQSRIINQNMSALKGRRFVRTGKVKSPKSDEHDSDSSDTSGSGSSTSSDVLEEPSEATMEALRKDREREMPSLRSRSSRLRTSASTPQISWGSSTPSEADLQFFNIINESKQFAESQSFTSSIGTRIRSFTNVTCVNSESSVIVPESAMFSTEDNYNKLSNKFSEEARICPKPSSVLTFPSKNQRLRKELQNISSKCVPLDLPPKTFSNKIRKAMDSLFIETRGHNPAQPISQLQLCVTRFFDLRSPNEIHAFLERIHQLSDPAKIQKEIYKERIKLEAEGNSLENATATETRDEKLMLANRIYKWLKVKPRSVKSVVKNKNSLNSHQKGQTKAIATVQKQEVEGDPNSTLTATTHISQSVPIIKMTELKQKRNAIKSESCPLVSVPSDRPTNPKPGELKPLTKPCIPVMFRQDKLRRMSDLKLKEDAEAAERDKKSTGLPFEEKYGNGCSAIVTSDSSSSEFYKMTRKPSGGNVFRTNESNPLCQTDSNVSFKPLTPLFQRLKLSTLCDDMVTKSEEDVALQLSPEAFIPAAPPQNGLEIQKETSLPDLAKNSMISRTKLPSISHTEMRRFGSQISLKKNLKSVTNRSVNNISGTERPVTRRNVSRLALPLIPTVKLSNISGPNLQAKSNEISSNSITEPKLDSDSRSDDDRQHSIKLSSTKLDNNKCQIKPFVIRRKKIQNLKSIPPILPQKILPSQEIIVEACELLETILFYRTVEQVMDSLRKNPEKRKAHPSDLLKKLYISAKGSFGRLTLLLTEAYLRQDKSHFKHFLRKFDVGINQFTMYVSALTLSTVRDQSMLKNHQYPQ